MLKLLRNNWSAKGIFYDATGNEIKWDYIVHLEELQRTKGLSLAPKITKQHIWFQNNKMKVRLAAQIFSNSVADALEYCKDRYPQFKGCDATIQFVRTINNLFDVLNSKSFGCKGYRAPLNRFNEKRICDFFASTAKYIEDLYILVPKQEKNVIVQRKTEIVKSGL